MDFHQTWYVHWIDIVKICYKIANRQIISFLTESSARNTSIFYFQDNNLSKSQWFFTRFDICIDIVDIALSEHLLKQLIIKITQ